MLDFKDVEVMDGVGEFVRRRVYVWKMITGFVLAIVIISYSSSR